MMSKKFKSEKVLLYLLLFLGVTVTYVLWFITTGVNTFALVLFAGGRHLSSLGSFSEIPRTYYLLALGLEGICFIAFSWIGLFLAQVKLKRK